MDVTKDAALTHQTLAVQTYRETQQDVQTAADADVIRVMAVQTAVTVTAAAETAGCNSNQSNNCSNCR